MADTLDSLIRLSRWQVDQKRRALADLLAQEEEQLARRRRLEEELQAERQAAAADPTGAGRAFAAYAEHHRQRLAEADQTLERLRAAIRAAHDELAEAFRQRKTFELAQEARQRRAREEAERREREALDEMALNQHRRRGHTAAQKGVARPLQRG